MKSEKKLNKKTGQLEFQTKDLPINDRGRFKPVPKEKEVKVTQVTKVPAHKRKTYQIKFRKHTIIFENAIIVD